MPPTGFNRKNLAGLALTVFVSMPLYGQDNGQCPAVGISACSPDKTINSDFAMPPSFQRFLDQHFQPAANSLKNRLTQLFPGNQSWLGKWGKDSNVMTGAGPNVPGFSGGHGGADYFLRINPQGQRCYSTSKATPDIAGGHKPAQALCGYGEIAMLYREDAKLPDCSAVLIGKAKDANEYYVLTAAHCVFDGNKTSTVEPVANLKDKYRILIPKSPTDIGTPKDCFVEKTVGNCGYLVGQFVQMDNKPMVEFAPTAAFNASRTSVAPDLALLKIRFTDEPNRYAKLWEPAAKLPSKLTQGGFGYREVTNSDNGSPGLLAVGRWENGQEVPVVDGIATLNHAEVDVAKACKIDSGSPVFSGVFNGQEEYARPLAGINIRALDATSSKTCTDGKGKHQVVQVISKPIKEWLCKDKRPIFGCP